MEPADFLSFKFIINFGIIANMGERYNRPSLIEAFRKEGANGDFHTLFPAGSLDEDPEILNLIKNLFDSKNILIQAGQKNPEPEKFLQTLQEAEVECSRIDKKQIEILVDGKKIRGSVSSFYRAYLQKINKVDKNKQWFAKKQK